MKSLKPIVVGGSIAGLLDIIYAFIVYGPLSYKLSPVAVLQSVANGWIGGTAASAGGAGTAFLGLFTHFMLATIMAMVFVLAARHLSFLTRSPVASGLIYGFGLYVVMNYIVLPLSAAHASQHFAADFQEVATRLHTSFSAIRPKNRWMLLGTLFTHMALVGIPISLANKRFQPTGT